MSADLNFIENICDIIDKNKLTSDHSHPVNDLQQIILRLWSVISIKTNENFVQSMPKHLQSCHRMKGQTSSKY